MTEQQRLNQIRDRIDTIDSRLMNLISERAEAAKEVANIKKGYAPETVFYRPEREAQILRKIKESNPGPLDGEEMAKLFREIMSACLALEQPLKIAFLGPSGTFTQAAVLKHFGHSVTTLPLGSIGDVFQEVETGNCHYGVVPVENSTEGIVNHTLDMFLNSPLTICGEVTLRIHHHLLSKASELTGLTRVYSHQQSFGQCRGWLGRHLPEVRQEIVGSNAEAAKLVTKQKDAAAIASDSAAEIYALTYLARNIEDEPNNTTRFLIIGPQRVPASGVDKTSLLLSTRNEAGGLHQLLAPLARHGISMTRIESRPSRRGNWDYVFFIDIDGHRDQPEVTQALDDLQRLASMCKDLGSYPKAVL